MLGEVADDDVVLDTPVSLLRSSSGRRGRGSAAVAVGAAVVPAAADAAVGQDVIDLVTDAYTAQREAEVARRRQVLYDLTHPNPADYTYNGRLVPPPPLSFGEITPEARELGNQLMLGQDYKLVRAAGLRVERDAGAGAGGDGLSRTGMVEVEVGGGGRARASANTAMAHRGRRREENPYRDHNFFFELSELYQEVVVVGRANAGKSSLLNALLGQAVAQTSSAPHSTRRINFYQSVTPEELQAFHARERHNLVRLPGRGLQLTFVDVPGYGIDGMSDRWRDAAIELTDAYFGVRRSVNTVLFCLDCDRGVTKTDLRYFEWLENVQGVFYIVLTKCDSVPHSRVCSVMRQLYTLITERRRKYRRVFPFVIPTSARTGANVELLRGLITETSGLIPGDRLRALLKQKQEAALRTALESEAQRLAAARSLERQQARQLFLSGGGGRTVRPRPEPRRVSGGTDADLDRILRVPNEEDDVECEGEGEGEGERARRQQQQRFLSWRRDNPLARVATPYGASSYRANTGLDNPIEGGATLHYTQSPQDGEDVDADVVVEPQPDAADAGAPAPTPPPAAPSPSPPPSSAFRVVGLDGQSHSSSTRGTAGEPAARATGAVSRHLDSVERFSNRTIGSDRPREGRGGKEKGKGAAALLVEAEDGRLVRFAGGRRGPALVSTDSSEARRRAEWQGQRLRRALQEANPEAPWAAVEAVRRRAERAREETALRGMRAKEAAAYMRDAGGVTESFDKFEGEIAATKYMTEVRVAPTLRSQQQMHLNSTAKINYRSMPPGLWKRYGKRDTHWPTPSVRGREADESHAPGTFHPKWRD